ncbi:MAG: ABC transporter permease [bacterium]|nr:ABC transporter permease [bacterium]
MRGKSKGVYYGRKTVSFLLSIVVLSIIVFYVSRLAPGDPLVSYYGDRVEKMSPDERAFAEEKLGLNDPISVQYVRWLNNAIHGEFGISYKYKMDVTTVIAGRITNTLLLGGIGFLVIFVFALLLGILCAWQEGRLIDRIICKIGTVTSAIPEFWISLLLILVFAVYLKVLPSSGAYSIGEENNIGDRAWHLVLPLSIVVIEHLWYYAYMIRNKILEEVRAEYVLLAKSKGLNKKSIMFGHCLRNVMPAYLSLMAISVPHILGGTYIVETVFSYPGIGTLSYESARYHDYNLLMLLCMISGVIVILCNMIAQIINERIDPRIRTMELLNIRGEAQNGE